MEGEPTYELEIDGFLDIPPDRLSDCLEFLKSALPIVRQHREHLGKSYAKVKLSRFAWVDDGKLDIHIEVKR